jgi:hypothetical protein
MIVGLTILLPVEAVVVSLVTLQGVSGLHEPEAQVSVSFAGEAGLHPLHAAGILPGLPQAGKLGHSGLTIAISAGPVGFTAAVKLIAGGEAGGVLDLGQTAGH